MTQPKVSSRFAMEIIAHRIATKIGPAQEAVRPGRNFGTNRPRDPAAGPLLILLVGRVNGRSPYNIDRQLHPPPLRGEGRKFLPQKASLGWAKQPRTTRESDRANFPRDWGIVRTVHAGRARRRGNDLPYANDPYQCWKRPAARRTV